MIFNLFSYLIIFFFGLIIGSFLNCVIYRLEKGQSFLSGRSFCPYCKQKLNWQDLIPLLSFFILNGKCRYCYKKISWQYPLVELATGILFVLIMVFMTPIVFTASVVLTTLWLFFIVSILIIIFVYDLKHYLILDKVIYPAIAITFLYNFINSYFILHTSHFILNTVFAAFIASAFLYSIFFISKGKWMGFGDVILALLMGLLLGWPKIFLALFGAFFIGAIMGIGLIIFQKKTLKSEVPFGPFLITGTLIALFWGQAIINWYISFIY